MNENDLRVQRTRRLLRQGLIDLVKSQGYESITTRDIAKKAQVGYKTFYRHYAGKEALLQALVDEMISGFRQVLTPPDAPSASKKNTIEALHYFKEHADLIQTLLQSSAANQLLNAAIELGRQEGQVSFQTTRVPQELVSFHFAASTISLLRWWLDNGMTIPIPEMAEYIDLLVIQSLKQLE